VISLKLHTSRYSTVKTSSISDPGRPIEKCSYLSFSNNRGFLPKSIDFLYNAIGEKNTQVKWIVSYAISREGLNGLSEGENESYKELADRLVAFVFQGFRVQAKSRFHSDFRDIGLKDIIIDHDYLAVTLVFECAGEPSEDYLPQFDFFEVIQLSPYDQVYAEKRVAKS